MSLTRRRFLTTTAAALPLASTQLPFGFPNGKLFSALLADPSDRILVIVNLTGGNDGLNTVVPLDQFDNLAALRSNIMLPQNRLLRLDDRTALHPSLTSVRGLWDDGKVGIVQGVGYPEPNRSHFRSSDIWSAGSSSDEVLQTGWLGRYFDGLYPGFPEGYPNAADTDPVAVTIGTVASETCQGLLGNFTLTVSNPLSMGSLLETAGGASPDNEYGSELDFVRTTIAQSNSYGRTVQAKTMTGKTVADYPSGNRLAQNLRSVAQMISGGLRTKAYVVNLGGFDTHANQVESGATHEGNHAELLAILSDAIAAFLADIKAEGLGERVIGMTYSEFGRQIRSNDGGGTDHGTAAPLLLFGDCIEPGILGQSPTIDRDARSQEGVPMQYDFRDVYGSILEDWFGLPAAGVRELLHDKYQRLPIIRRCGAPVSGVSARDLDVLQLTAAPSAFTDRLSISFTLARAGRVSLAAYDVQGSYLETLFDRRLPAGEQTVNVDASSYPKGVIIFRLQEGDAVRVVRTVKL